MWIHLWRPTRDIYGVVIPPLGKGQDCIHCLCGHYFLTDRTGFEMAMPAQLVAEQTDIYLQGSCLVAPQLKPMPRENIRKRFNDLKGLM